MNFSLNFLFKLTMASALIGAGVGYGRFYLFHLILFSFFIGCGFYYFRYKSIWSRFEPVNNKYFNIFYLMILWYFLGLTWAANFFYSIRYLYYLMVGILIVYFINAYATTQAKFAELFNVFKIVFYGAMIIGCLESWFDFRLPSSTFYKNYLPDAAQMSGLDDYSVSYLMSSPTAYWGNPNNFAIAMLIAFPYFLLYPKKLVKYIGSSILVGLIMMTGSRACLIGLIVCYLFYVLLFLKRIYSLIFMLSIVILGVFFVFIGENYFNKIIEYYLFLRDIVIGFQDGVDSDDSVGVRIILIKNGLQAFWDSGGIGIGGGGSEFIQYKSGLETVSMHNFWVEILVEAGLLFFILFILWYCLVLRRLYSICFENKINFNRYHAGSLFLAFIGFVPGAISASSVIYFSPMWIMFGLSISVIHLSRCDC